MSYCDEGVCMSCCDEGVYMSLLWWKSLYELLWWRSLYELLWWRSLYELLWWRSLYELLWWRSLYEFAVMKEFIWVAVMKEFIWVAVMKEFIKQDQQIKTTLARFLQEQKYMRHLFFFIVLKSEISLVRKFGELNQQFNLKWKFSVPWEPKKARILRLMTQMVWSVSDYILVI